MRLFVAVDVPDYWGKQALILRDAIERGIESYESSAIRWVASELMHVTLRFLGEVEDQYVDSLRQALAGTVPPVDLNLTLGRVCTFGTPARTRVMWLGVGGDIDGLRAIVSRVDNAVAKVGLSTDARAFRAHFTLARLKSDVTPDMRRKISHALVQLEDPPRLPYRARSIVLVRSRQDRDGLSYEVVSRHS